MKRIGLDINDTVRNNLLQFKNCYRKAIDKDFKIDLKGIRDFDLSKVFPFESKDDFNYFKYVDYAYELFARAEPMDKMLPYKLNTWLQNTMRDFDEGQNPEIFMFSPFESGLTIQATYAFLTNIGCRCREMLFPVDSQKVWGRCDIMITANPNLLKNAPEGKVPVKICAPYNQNIPCEHAYNSLIDLFEDKDESFSKLIVN